MKAYTLYEDVNAASLACVAALTAGGSGDNTEITCTALDCMDVSDLVLAIPFKAILAQDATLTFTIKVGESSDNSAFDADETLVSAATVSTGGSGGSTNYDTYELKVDVKAQKARKRYLRFKITPNLSAANTDTAIIGATALLGGQRVAPVSHTA